MFSSRGRVKVLKLLVERSELNISEITRNAALNHSTTLSHLEWLRRAGLVEEKRFGRIRIYRFRLENPKAKAIRALFDAFDGG